MPCENVTNSSVHSSSATARHTAKQRSCTQLGSACCVHVNYPILCVECVCTHRLAVAEGPCLVRARCPGLLTSTPPMLSHNSGPSEHTHEVYVLIKLLFLLAAFARNSTHAGRTGSPLSLAVVTPPLLRNFTSITIVNTKFILASCHLNAGHCTVARHRGVMCRGTLPPCQIGT